MLEPTAGEDGTASAEGDGWVNWSGLATALGELSQDVAERVIRLSCGPAEPSEDTRR
jgi:hypothetical protein